MSTDPFVNREFDNIRVLERIASGGMAVVYRAFDMRRNVQVALKLIHEQYAYHEEAMERFRREIEIAQWLQHPNIVRVYDFGMLESRMYMTMQYMDGGSLLDPLANNIPVSPEQVAAWIEQVASALDYAHKQGIIHRDLKPGNVLLDSSYKANLSDFGIARLNDAAKLTRSGLQMPGTAHYMSPEQVMGTSLTSQSDVYALAVLAYVFMVRRYPFDADSEMAIAFQHVNNPIPVPTEVNPRLPIALDAVIAKGLAKKPEDRYQDAMSFAAAFTHALGVSSFQAMATKPKSSPPPTARQATPTPFTMPSIPSNPQTAPKKQSRSLLYGGIGVIVVLILLGLMVVLLSGGGDDEEPIPSETAIAAEFTAEATPEVTPENTSSPTETSTPTDTPTEEEDAEAAQATLIRQSAESTATELVRQATENSAATQTAAPPNTATEISTATPTLTSTSTLTASPTSGISDTDATVTAIVEAVIATQTAIAAPPLLPPVTIAVVHTPTPASGDPIVTANISANVRAGDSTSYAPIGALLEGESASVLGITNGSSGWFFIELDDGTQGWVASSLVLFSGDLDELDVIAPPTMTPTRTPTRTPTPTITPTPPSGANLTGGAVSLSPNPPSCNAGVQVQMTVRNNGTVATTSTVSVRVQDVQASTGTVLNSFVQTVPVLNPSTGFLVSRANWILSAYPNEEHFIRVTIDVDSDQIESNEADNVWVSETFILQPGSC